MGGAVPLYSVHQLRLRFPWHDYHFTAMFRIYLNCGAWL